MIFRSKFIRIFVFLFLFSQDSASQNSVSINFSKSLEISSTNDDILFGYLNHLQIDSHGNIIANDWSSKSLLSIDINSGKLIQVYDSQGRGPGEFLQPSTLFLDSIKDSLYVYDSSRLKILCFNLIEGKFHYSREFTVTSKPLSFPSIFSLVKEKNSDNLSFLFRYKTSYSPNINLSGAVDKLSLVNKEGRIKRDNLVSVQMDEAFVRQGGGSISVRTNPLGAKTVFRPVLHGTKFFLGNGRFNIIQVIDIDGEVLDEINLDFLEEKKVTDEIINSYLSESYQDRFSDLINEYLPYYKDFFISEKGIWVQTHDNELFLIDYDSHEVLNKTNLGSNLDIKHISENRIYGLENSEYEQKIIVYNYKLN